MYTRGGGTSKNDLLPPYCTLLMYNRGRVGPPHLTGGDVLTGSADKTAKLWNLSSGECIRTFEGHTNRVCSVALQGEHVLTSPPH